MSTACTPSNGRSSNDVGTGSSSTDVKQTSALSFSHAGKLMSAALRLTHTVSEGVQESLVNLCQNLVEMLPSALRLKRQEPYAEDLTGKVAIVTGGNAGIGFETAKQLARRGAHVVIACRDRARAEAAVQAIRSTPPLILPSTIPPPSSSAASPGAPAPAPPPPLLVESMDLDLGRLSSVRRFAEEWAARGLPLHLLVCNAGVMAPLKKTLTHDGVEVQFQVNFLSHWLLTHLLLERERVRRREAAEEAAAAGSGSGKSGAKRSSSASASSSSSAPAASTRVVVVSSVVHRAGQLMWDDMLSQRSYEPYITYGVSKLATVILAKELQRRMDRHPEYGKDDTAVAVHPGLVRTYLANNFFRSYGLSSLVGTSLEPLQAMWRRFVDSSFQGLLIPPEVAADRMLAACLGPRDRLAGRYMSMGRVYGAAKASDDPACAAQLWDTAVRLTGYTPGPSLA